MQRGLLAGTFILVCFFLPTGAAAVGGLALKAKQHDFGNVQYGDTVRTSVALTNTGADPITIEKLRTSCDCTKAVVDRKNIPPGESAKVEVSFDSDGLTPGKKTQSVFIHTAGAKKAAATFRIFAAVVQDVRIEPKSLVRRMKRRPDELTVPLKLENGSEKPVTIGIAKFRGALTGAELHPATVTIGPGQRKESELLLTFADRKDDSLYRGAVILKTDHPKEDKLVFSFFIKVREPE